MDVVYNDPNGAAVTYHPQLGKLESGKVFDLSDIEAIKYIQSGLLKKSPKSNKAEVKENDGHTTDR